MVGGERKAVELLEEESRKQTRQPLLGGEGKPKTKQKTTFYNFMFHPCAVGERMLTIEKFGLVQYVRKQL